MFATVEKIDCCHKKAVLNIWMYNRMGRASMGSYSYLFYGKTMYDQFMWWNWKEKVSWSMNTDNDCNRIGAPPPTIPTVLIDDK